MQWSDFLAEVGDTHLLSPEQKAAFLARLDDKNDKNGQSEAKVASNLNISVAAFKKLMSEVYKKFAQSCPELAASGSRGKLEKLRACLRAKYTERLTGTPTTSNSQVGKAHPTPNAPTPTLYENLGRKGVERDRFIGRDEKLKELHDLLQENAQVAITAAVIGMGGVGKTELAIQYAREQLKTYQGGVCWLPASDFALKLVEFARPRFFPNVNFDGYSLAEQVGYCWQHWAEGDVLLVLDDVTDYKQQVQPDLPESSRFKVLITTRERLGKPIVLLDLEVLTPRNALDLLKSFLGNERVERELDIATELCEWLGYLPLGLELVGRYLEEEPLSIAQMLERLKRKRLRHPSLVQADPMMTAQLGVADAFELSWERLDENAQQLGCLLSLFALAPIPWQLVEEVYHSLRGEGFEPEDLEKPRRDLIKLHLLKTDKETYSLHQLIREFLQIKLVELMQSTDLKQAVTAKLAMIAESNPVCLTAILEEGLLDWSFAEDVLLPLEFGWQVKTAMQAWVNGISSLAQLVAPLREDKTLPAFGVRIRETCLDTSPPIDTCIRHTYLQTGWYFGNDMLDAVVELPVEIEEPSRTGWNYLKEAPLKQQLSWAWQWTHEDLVNPLSFLLQQRRLPIDEGPIVSEGAWHAAFFLTGRYSPTVARLDPIPLAEIERCLSQFHKSSELLGRGVDEQRLNQLNLEMKRLQRAGETHLRYPWSNRFNPNQVFAHAIDVYKGALEGYQQLINKWFPKFSSRLQTAALLPALISGVVMQSPKDEGGVGVSWYWEVLPPGNKSNVKLQPSDRPISGDDTCFCSAFDKLRLHRPEIFRRYRTMTLHKVDCTMFNFTPVTDLVYSWLWKDLEKVAWVKGRLGGSGLYREVI